MAMIKVKPARTGTGVLKENGVLLAADGEYVEKTMFWIRRIKDGDAVEIKDDTKKKGA